MKPRLKNQDNQTVTTETATPTTIGFRLDEDTMRVMCEQAEAAHTSIHELARGYVIDMMHLSPQLDQFAYGISSVWTELNSLRRDFALAVEMLLVTAAKLDRAKAADWVDNNLKSKCSQSPNQGEAPHAPTTT